MKTNISGARKGQNTRLMGLKAALRSVKRNCPSAYCEGWHGVMTAITCIERLISAEKGAKK